MNTIEQAREVAASLRHGPISDITMLNGADTINALIAERADITNRLHDANQSIGNFETALAALKAQQPVASIVFCHTPSGKRVALNSSHQNLPIGTPLFLAAGAQPEVVKWGVDWGTRGDRSCVSIVKRHADGTLEVVATEYQPEAGAQEQRKPLTDEEVVEVLGNLRESITGNVFLAFARAIEAAHGIKT